jgi:hypothetical protein
MSTRPSPRKPWFHAPSGLWCAQIAGKRQYLDRDPNVALRTLSSPAPAIRAMTNVSSQLKVNCPPRRRAQGRGTRRCGPLAPLRLHDPDTKPGAGSSTASSTHSSRSGPSLSSSAPAASTGTHGSRQRRQPAGRLPHRDREAPWSGVAGDLLPAVDPAADVEWRFQSLVPPTGSAFAAP